MAASKAAPPIGARKLNREIRYKMAKHAVEKFRRPDLREIEAGARQNIVNLFVRDALAIPKSEIKALERHGFARSKESLTLPYEITVADKVDRTFEKPNGETVTRPSGKGRTVRAPCGREEEIDRDLPRFTSWHYAEMVRLERSNDSYAHQVLKFGRSIIVPSDGHGTDLYLRWTPEQRVGFTLDSTTTLFLSTDIAPAITAYFVAADERIMAERRLICTAIKIIGSCATYGQVVDAWPEVAEIEEKLFEPSVLPNAFALVALSDEDKAALCANMASRGVTGGLCSRQAA